LARTNDGWSEVLYRFPPICIGALFIGFSGAGQTPDWFCHRHHFRYYNGISHMILRIAI
jgi:hypothetical protein